MFERDITLEQEIGRQFRKVIDGEQTYRDLRGWYWQNEPTLSWIDESPRYDNLLIKGALDIFDTLSDGISDVSILADMADRLEGKRDTRYGFYEGNGIHVTVTYKASAYLSR